VNKEKPQHYQAEKESDRILACLLNEPLQQIHRSELRPFKPASRLGTLSLLLLLGESLLDLGWVNLRLFTLFASLVYSFDLVR